ncbi:MAG: extracellular solute-binding protein [Hyphomicrobiaceae bacterium]|nr:extracellular solute-binding protein [Hyphomicrobiaceae bacterium]
MRGGPGTAPPRHPQQQPECRVTLLAVLASLLAALLPADAGAAGQQGIARHGIAMHGEPALPPGFTHLPYVNPDAPKGGRLRLGALGTFDSVNPFIIKGVTPSGVREYVYESLMARSQDEPFTLYGLIAGRVELPEDRSSITFHLRPEARFSDGHPITPADVLHSHALLKEKGWPYHRSYYSKVAHAEAVGPHAVRFTFKEVGDREIPLILGLMPILPAHRMTPEQFERTSLDPPVGSGPYVIAHVEPGRAVVFRRNPDHWAKDLPITRGRYNFDEIRLDFYRDSASLFEAFKAGQIDARVEDDPGRWAEGYGFQAVADGRVVKGEFKTGLPAGMTGLVFNTRRPVFADQRVRRALTLMFDAEWINRNLFHGLYVRTDSFFDRSELASTGHPASALERNLLAPFEGKLHPAVLEGRARLPVGDGSGNNRAALREAYDLLSAAGYELEGTRLVHAVTGAPLAFEFLASTRAQERLMLSYAGMLERLGIAVSIRQVDSAQYWARLKSFDFDMIQWTWGSSLSPGNEQINRWSSRAADTEGSLNYAGVKSPAADAMIGTLLTARTYEELTAAVRAFDRVLLSGDYVIPLFHIPKQWIAHWSHLQPPERPALLGTDFDTWWQSGAAQ